jgi:hypothetical protein
MSLVHNIRFFVETKLRDIVPWAKVEMGEVTGDSLDASFVGKVGNYRLKVQSSYIKPPLGMVTLQDLSNQHVIEGDNQDLTWHQIEQYVKGREGLEKPVVVQTPQAAVDAVIGGAEVVTVRPDLPTIPIVRFIAAPGEHYNDGPAIVTNTHEDGSLDLTVFPNGSEPAFRRRIARKTDALKNICWEPITEFVGDQSVQTFMAEVADRLSALEQLVQRVAALEAKRGPGRPAKVA